jgi:hypothetical protein
VSTCIFPVKSQLHIIVIANASSCESSRTAALQPAIRNCSVANSPFAAAQPRRGQPRTMRTKLGQCAVISSSSSRTPTFRDTVALVTVPAVSFTSLKPIDCIVLVAPPGWIRGCCLVFDILLSSAGGFFHHVVVSHVRMCTHVTRRDCTTNRVPSMSLRRNRTPVQKRFVYSS